MNKNLYLGIISALGMALVTSCSNDEMEQLQDGGMAQVSFALSLDEDIATRAISDGTGADKLVYAVFDETGTRISGIQKVEKSSVTFPTTETLTLAKGQTYKVAFWAQDGDCTAYTIDDAMNVSVNYDSATNNDETRDAFFKTETFTVTGSASIDVELRRPFAQINVGVTDADLNAAKAAGIEVAKSSVVISKAANAINLVNGSVTGEAGVTYDLADIPTEKLSVDVDGNGEISEAEKYNYLSMSYILAPEEKSTLESLKFTFKPQAGNDIVFAEGLTNVPVQRNWRTNIIGKILSGDVTFNISIDPIYENDNNIIVNNAAEFAAAAAKGGNITLGSDIVLPTAVTFANDVVLDGNGNSIEGQPLHFNGQNTTLKNITFDNARGSKQSHMYFAKVGTKNLTIENCNFYNAQWDCIQLTHADESVAIRNCYFKNDVQGYRYIHLEIRDDQTGGSYADTNATVEISNCTFENVSQAYCKDSAITIIGFTKSKMNFKDNVVKGDGADKFTTIEFWITEGKNGNALLELDWIKQGFKYTSEQ